MIRVKISGVAIDPVTKGFVVILKDETEKKMASYLGRTL